MHKNSKIVQSIDYKLTKEIETHYSNLNRKLDKLQKEKQTKRKTDTHYQRTQFYTRTVNLTNITWEMWLVKHNCVTEV